MLLQKTFLLFTILFTANVNAYVNLTWTGYCPFNISLAPADDPKSLDLTYAPTNTPINPVMFDGKACLVEIWIYTPDERGDIYLEQFEYTSNKEMAIETKVAWNGAFAPTLYESVSVTTNIPVFARNTTFNSFPYCVQHPRSNYMWIIFLQTKFSDAAVKADFQLEQKAHLRFGDSKNCTVREECDQQDIDGKFPPCHGIPGAYLWDNETTKSLQSPESF